MKKILLTAAAVSVLSTSSAYAMKNTFYVKANAGWSKLNKIGSVKSNNDVHVGAGVGYHVMDKVRVDLTFDHFINPTFKVSNSNGGITNSTKIELDINTLLLNGYFNVFNIDSFKFFIGAGAGISSLKGKKTNTISFGTTSASTSKKSKQEYRFAYAGYVGVENKFTQDITGELSYSYRSMGNVDKDINKSELRGHHVTAGVRFNF